MNSLYDERNITQKANEEIDLLLEENIKKRAILNKWIALLDNGVLNNSKEEEFQGEFLNDIFCEVLNAKNKASGSNEWNLERETKTEIDGQKADGVLGFFDVNGKKDVRVAIELKGAKVSLDVRQKRVGDTRTPVEQAFGYAPKYGKNCQWVIVSNFKTIRLYRSNSMLEYYEFSLDKLRDDLEFKKFIYMLSFETLVEVDNKKAKAIILAEEYQKKQAEIEKKFYNEYKQIRLNIFENIKSNNKNIDEHLIIEKVQKLLDRFLFICFCEDKNLLPVNSFEKAIELGKQLSDLGIFETFKMLCNWINLGNSKQGIPHFNGGLFKADEILDSLIIDDYVFEEMRKISEYDFESDLNENILGHIFEQSISDIEELKKKLNGEEFDNKKSKRKKDGIFYTPKYITKYIVENSIKNWLDDKRKELGEDDLPKLTEKDFQVKYQSKASSTRVYTENYKKHIEFWQNYREAVKNIKIVDPACGSGAFLITAFEFLLKHNKSINEELANLTGSYSIDDDELLKEILENNIFGVDLNKESVEITKLSLWLKTANKNKTLSTLENNIKCGNSLIDDVDVAGELAFNWEKEFPQVFDVKEIARELAPLSGDNEKIEENRLINNPREQISNIEAIAKIQKQESILEKSSREQAPLSKGGFDVIVGNPPYGVSFDEKTKKYLQNSDKLVPDYEIYIYFISLYKRILKKNGYLSYIFPNTFLSTLYGIKYRENLFKNISIKEIVDLSDDNTFVDASVRTIIFSFKNILSDYESIFTKIINKKFELFEKYSKNEIIKNIENISSLFFQNMNEKEIVKKIQENSKLKDYFEISQGLIPYDKYRGHDEYTIKNRIWHSNIRKDETYKKELKGGDIAQYSLNWNGELWISYGEWLAAPREKKFFVSERILIREITGDKLFASYTDEEYYNTPSLINIINEKKILNLKYILTILNSKLTGWYHNKTSPKANKGLFPKILVNDVRNLPIKEISLEAQKPFIEKADKMLFLNKELQNINSQFQRLIMRKFELEKLSTKLQDWHLIDFSEFIKEINKLKVKLSLIDEMKWEETFLSQKEKATKILDEINKTDNEIDKMVYELYELTEEEINLIEENKL